MPNENLAHFRTEGEPAFSTESTETVEQTTADSLPETNEVEGNPSSEGENNIQMQPKNLPFDKDPRIQDYVDRQVKKHLEGFQKQYATEMSEIKEKFGAAREANAKQEEIPEWFGGDQKQWDLYRQHQDSILKQAEERAYKRLQSEKEEDNKRVQEANTFFQSELSEIESSKELNPNNLRIDPNRLLKTAEDFDLIDSKGRWNYKAAWKILQSQMAMENGSQSSRNRKVVAGATTSESRAEAAPAPYKTSADFKKKKPW